MTQTEREVAQWTAKATDTLERDYPSIFKIFYPRRFAAPGSHYSPRHLAGNYTGLVASLSEPDLVEKIRADWTLNCTLIVVARLGAIGMPTYWVTREFLEAMLEATPPSDMKISDLLWPLDGLNIILPRDCLLDPSGSPLQFISAARAFKGMETGKAKGEGLDLVCELDGLAFCAHTAAGCFYAQSAPGYDRVTDMSSYDIKYGQSLETMTDKESKPVTKTDDNAFVGKMTGLLANILMYMMAAKDSDGSFVACHDAPLERRAKPAKGIDELWGPAWIGRDYRHPRMSQGLGGTHASPRTHWRKSHYRQQVYGQGRALRKTIFVPRMLVNPAPEAQPTKS